ncbi:MAG: discoidin domain-containing protein [Odoribacteraceae bacterium]|jgi:hypothetical protein|nr:discoidin domain-containing protein [Odoribacteraceae bacterium]
MNKSFLFGALLLACAACDDMTDIYRDYLDRGETIYIGRVDSLQLFPGNGRVMLAWEINADPKLVECIVYIDGRADSVVVPIIRDAEGGRQAMSVVVEGLSERGHIFEIRTRDANGNVSLKTEKSAICYGARYVASLSNRAVVGQEADPGEVRVSWGMAENAIGVEMNYVNNVGVPVSVVVLPEETVSVFADYVSGGEFSYSTLYLPVPTSIDTFRAAPVVMNFARAAVPLTNKGDWTLVEETSHGSYGWTFDGGAWAFDGDNSTGWHSGWSGEMLPQWITIDLGDVYTLAAVELYRPGESWREDTEAVEVWVCDNPALDPLVAANFHRVATVNFEGSEESHLTRLAEVAPVQFIKLVGTRAQAGKSAIQIMEVNLSVLQ